jgi:hypothetical protein
MALSLLQYAAQSPNVMTKGLVERIVNKSLFMGILNFIKMSGTTYPYGRRDALPVVQERAIGENAVSVPSIINPEIETAAILSAEIDTDTVIMDQSGDTARGNEISGAIKAAGLRYDYLVIKGDPANNPRQFPGLRARIQVGTDQRQNCGVNGGALTSGMVELMIDAVVGDEENKYIVTNKRGRRNLTALRRGFTTVAQMLDQSTTQIADWNGVKIKVLDEYGTNTPILSQNEQFGTNPNTSSMYCVKVGDDQDGEYMQGLLGNGKIAHRDVGILGTFYRDVIEMFAGVALFTPTCASMIEGIVLL